MLIQRKVFEIFVKNMDKEYQVISDLVKNDTGSQLLLYEYATMLGLKKIANANKIDINAIFEHAYSTSIPKGGAVVNGSVQNTGKCGGCGGGVVR